MLEINNIKKIYQLKDTKVEALKGVTMRFRRSEFVSILGPSGCGKTTLLNVIGGLDRYNDGDLIIDGVSTKNYKDKDWDNYRNHRIGFVFQSYNLIPHQTVLENVELALTLSGIKRSERRKRASEVLNKVGLGDKLKSKPSQLSGGQMQRVAIARALVNNPEIILADEPTGALDSKTSVQIMDLLKEVSKDRLVIMVTHNPELAEQYSSRIIKLLDGELIEDSKPYSEKDCAKDTAKRKEELQKRLLPTAKKTKQRKEKTSMSFFTAMFLSLKNLLSKVGRTVMVSIAGSIGIIGIALILAVSSGMTGYINNMQSQSLSSYPISVLYMAIDTNEVMNAVMGGGSDNESVDKTDDNNLSVSNPTSSLYDLGSYNYITNDFVNHVNKYYSNKQKQKFLNSYQITYSSDMRLIIKNEEFKNEKFQNSEYVPINSTITSSALTGSVNSTFFKELDKEYVLSMYDMIGEGARYPQTANEVALVINSEPVTVSTLYSLGLLADTTKTEISMDNIIGQQYKLLYNDAYYEVEESIIKEKVNFDELYNEDGLPNTETYAKYLAYAPALYNDVNTENLEVTCVLKLKKDSAGSIFSDGLMYTEALGEMYKQNCQKSDIVKQFYVNYFKTDATNTYFVNANGENIIKIEDATVEDYSNLVFDKTMASEAFDKPYKVNISELKTYFNDASLAQYFVYKTPKDMLETLNIFGLKNMSYEDIMQIYLQMYSASEIPLAVSFYVNSFEAKDDLVAMITDYNKTAKYKLLYSDSSQLITNMLKSLVDIVSYVLIAFAAISLIVSSIMISIITYTSVIERTKEIGVLRSVGASKKDIFWVFTAETVIIGLVAGAIGVGVAGMLSVLVSIMLKGLTGVGSLAVLQPLPCLILVFISVMLTFIAGLIPSNIATKKDPVLALRSE